jgi:hypothetical protein
MMMAGASSSIKQCSVARLSSKLKPPTAWEAEERILFAADDAKKTYSRKSERTR